VRADLRLAASRETRSMMRLMVETAELVCRSRSKVTRFGDAECGFDSLEKIAHLSYEHYVRIPDAKQFSKLAQIIRVGIYLTR